jgi:hypothetical protein
MKRNKNYIAFQIIFELSIRIKNRKSKLDKDHEHNRQEHKIPNRFCKF